MLLELTESLVARVELRIAGERIVEMLSQLAAGASAESVRDSWPPGHRPRADAVAAVAELSVDERGALRDAVAADLAFDADFENPAFRFAFPRLDPTVRAAGASLLSSMYHDVFGSAGFRFADIPVNRKSWEASFRQANPGIGVCPACVSNPLEGPVGDRSLVDADHYLPKSKYASLAVHGLNLIPLCKPCNQTLKGSLDPLSDGGGAVTLRDIWFPYRRAGIQELVLGFAPREKVSVRFEGSPPALERAQRFDRLFELSTRWSATFGGIAERLPTILTSQLMVRPEAAEIRAGLEMLKRMADADIEVEERAFIRSRYYGWLLDNPDAFHGLVEEVKAIDREDGDGRVS